MAVIEELIREEENGSLSFGNYELTSKTKQNGMFVYESVPGTAVHGFMTNGEKVVMTVEGENDAQITLELEPEKEYKVHVGGVYVGKMSTNLGGKLVLSVGFEENDSVEITVEKQ